MADEDLLGAGDPPPVEIVNPNGGSPFVLIGDHAGRLIPAALGSLGLSEEELSRHIGWDIGVDALGERLAVELDAVFVRQRYSRLVVDCNRAPDAIAAMPPVSDGTPVPGNQDLSAAQRAARLAAIHAPYHQAIGTELNRRRRADTAAVLVALHSFTPALRAAGAARPWQIGVLHDQGDPAFAQRLIQVLRDRSDLVVGDNQPYTMSGIDYTVPRHAYPSGLPYAEIEIRQDLLAADADIRAWSELLATALHDALGAVAQPAARSA